VGHSKPNRTVTCSPKLPIAEVSRT